MLNTLSEEICDPLIRMNVAGSPYLASLPETYAALIDDKVDAFPALGFGRAFGVKGKKPAKFVSKRDPGCHTCVLSMSFISPSPACHIPSPLEGEG